MTRFTVILSPRGCVRPERDRIVASVSSRLGGCSRFDIDGATVLASKQTPVDRDGADGLIIGPSFANARVLAARHAAGGGASDRGSISERFERRWGDYVLVSPQAGNEPAIVARAPMGGTACYYLRLGSLVVVTSHIRDVLPAMATVPAIDWTQVAGHLCYDQLRAADTCLYGISELIGGETLQLANGGIRTVPLWSPWTFCRNGAQLADYDEAVAGVRDAVRHCVAAQAGRFSRVLLTVSGGLDSSIVAAALQASRIPFSCLTMFTQERAGDERDYARILSERLGVDLRERPELQEDIDLERSGAADLPRPTSRGFAQSGDAAQMRIAASIGADVFFTGAGGDSVFCYLASVAPVADRLRAPVDWAKALDTARDIAAMTGTALPNVLIRGARRAWLRSPSYRWPKTNTLLSDAARRLPRPDHPWLNAPPGACPGKAGHIASLIAIQNHLEGYVRQQVAPIVHPLLSLPIVEACLRVPSWMWCAGGRNRAVARDAFAGVLPDTLVRRSTKGTPGGFIARLYDARRTQIREMLLDGHLVASGIIDRPALESVLGRPASARSYDYLRVMLMVDVEAWARSWGSAPQVP